MVTGLGAFVTCVGESMTVGPAQFNLLLVDAPSCILLATLLRDLFLCLNFGFGCAMVLLTNRFQKHWNLVGSIPV